VGILIRSQPRLQKKNHAFSETHRISWVSRCRYVSFRKKNKIQTDRLTVPPVSAQGMVIPPACTSLCPIVEQFLNVTAATLPPLCTTQVQQEVIACYTCIETNAPTELSTDDLNAAQGSFNALQTACGNLGVRYHLFLPVTPLFLGISALEIYTHTEAIGCTAWLLTLFRFVYSLLSQL